MRFIARCLLAVLAIGTLATALSADVIVYDISAAARLASGAGGGGNAGAGAEAQPMGASADPMAAGLGAAGTDPSGIPKPANTTLRIALQGEATLQGRLVTYRHPSLKDQLAFHLDVDPMEIVEAPTLLQQFNKRFGQAGKDPAAMMKAAVWGLKKGLLRDFYSSMDKVLAIDPKYEPALKVLEMKKTVEAALTENPATEQELKALVQKPGMRIATSKHYILLTDTPSKAEAGRRRNRAEERLALLEQNYEIFIQLFTAQGVQGLEVPKERLKVILFQEYRDFHDYQNTLNPTLSSTSGFWDPARNVCAFHDGGTSEEFTALDNIAKGIKNQAEQARRQRGDPNLIRFAKTIDLLVEVSRENADVKTVTREGTLQLAGSTGLLPRQVMVPLWVKDGLATYFESPADAAWAGVGAVSDRRLAPERANLPLDLIVMDQAAGGLGGTRSLSGGPSWALTHYLFENRMPELMNYYRMLAEMPADVVLGPDVLAQVFERAFGGDRKRVELEWRNGNRALKSDVEIIKETGKVTKSRNLTQGTGG